MPLVITDVSSFDEAGAQLVRLDAHFQTDCRARRARLHHVLPFPRMRVLKGMWRSVAAGEGRGSTSRPIWAQLVQQFRKILARKPRYPTTRASFLYSIAGCFSVVGRIPRSGPRSIRERPTTADRVPICGVSRAIAGTAGHPCQANATLARPLGQPPPRLSCRLPASPQARTPHSAPAPRASSTRGRARAWR